jgi:hypothetical protein
LSEISEEDDISSISESLRNPYSVKNTLIEQSGVKMGGKSLIMGECKSSISSVKSIKSGQRLNLTI